MGLRYMQVLSFKNPTIIGLGLRGGEELKLLLSFLEKKYQILQMIPGDGNTGKHSSGVRSFNGRL